MTVTLHGTYTKNNGQSVAAGTVDITPDGAAVSHQVPDAAGHFSVALAGTRFTVVETFGSDVKTKVVSAVDGESIDLGRDIGRTTGGGATDVEPVAAHQAATAAPAAITSAVPAALTSAVVATADGSDAATTQALANALKAALNLTHADLVTARTERTAVQADVVVLRAEVAQLTTDLDALLTKLQAASIMATS